MKKVFIASAILASSLVFSKANAQLFVSARVEFQAAPIPIVIAAPRIVYPAPACRQPVTVGYYRTPLSTAYYQQEVSVPYYHRAAPNFYREEPNCYREAYYKHSKYHKNW